MTRFSSDARQRRSRKYQSVVRELQGGAPAEHLGPVKDKFTYRVTYTTTPGGICDALIQPDKQSRKRQASASFRATGE